MRVIDIIKVREKLKPFNVELPQLTPNVKLSGNPSLNEVFKAFKAFNIPYQNLTIQEMQSVVKLMQQRYKNDPDNTIVLQVLNAHLEEVEVWSKGLI